MSLLLIRNDNHCKVQGMTLHFVYMPMYHNIKEDL